MRIQLYVQTLKYLSLSHVDAVVFTEIRHARLIVGTFGRFLVGVAVAAYVVVDGAAVAELNCHATKQNTYYQNISFRNP